MSVLSLFKGSILSVLVLSLMGCIPTVTRMWDVQPVSGRVFDAGNNEPVVGARIVNADNAALVSTSDENGEFLIKPQSSVRFHLRMFGSYIDRQVWHVTHDDYPAAVTLTRTHAPPLSEQPANVAVPMFRGLQAGPEDCRFGPYLLALYEYARQEKHALSGAYLEWPDPYFMPCEDRDYREKLDASYRQLWEAEQ